VAANNLAWIYSSKNGDLEKALSMAQKARELAPENPSIADTLGWILYQRGVFEAALPPLREASEKLPNNAEIRYHYGMALLKTGDKEGAKRELTKALADKPTVDGAEDAKKALAGL
jgi:Flp pilus assembly protein TadD